jgi:hypothetical protein
MNPTLRGKIFAVKSCSVNAASGSYLSVISTVNRTLDAMIGDTDEELVKLRHESIVGPALLKRDPIDAEIEVQSLLSGAAIVGNLSVVKALLNQGDIDVNGWARYFDSPLTLAAGQGHLSIVQYLLDCGARLDSVASNWSRDPGLECQADWNSADEQRWCLSLNEHFPSALRSAVLNGHDDMVDLLLLPRYRLPITSLEYLRAIMAGARAGRLDLI